MKIIGVDIYELLMNANSFFFPLYYYWCLWELSLGGCDGNRGAEHAENERYTNDEKTSHNMNFIAFS